MKLYILKNDPGANNCNKRPRYKLVAKSKLPALAKHDSHLRTDKKLLFIREHQLGNFF